MADVQDNYRKQEEDEDEEEEDADDTVRTKGLLYFRSPG